MNEQIKNIAAKFNITEAQATEVREAALVDGLDTIDEDLYMVLFGYYCDNNKIPYEEASRGDPYAWIAQDLQKEFNIYA